MIGLLPEVCVDVEEDNFHHPHCRVTTESYQMALISSSNAWFCQKFQRVQGLSVEKDLFVARKNKKWWLLSLSALLHLCFRYEYGSRQKSF